MVDKVDPVIELNSADKSSQLTSGDGTVNKVQASESRTFKFSQLLWIFIGAMTAVGLSYYWTVSSDNVMQAFIPYDEDKAILMPDSEQQNTSAHGADKRLQELEEKLVKIAHDLHQLSHQPQTDNAPLHPVESQITDVVARINQIEQRLDRYMHHQKNVVDIYLTFDRLQEGINQGNAFESILNHFIEMMQPYNDVQNIVHPLSEYASVGVASYTQLLDELATIMLKHNQENTMAGDKNKWWDRAFDMVKSIVKVHKIVDSNTVFKNSHEIYSRVENLLLTAHIKPAVELMAGFEKDFSHQEHNFYNQMTARMTVEDTLLKLNKLLSSPGFVQLLNTLQ